MIKVEVPVKDAPYTIYLGEGIFHKIQEELERLHPSSVLVVTNVTVGPLYAAEVLSYCRAVCRSEIIELPDGEQYKNWESISAVLEKLAGMTADRKTVVVALGGGVVGDMAGFAASIYMRGIRCIQVPTTLLAQVDSSVGGKTGINMRAGKNMIGAFHQPSAVVADTRVLRTLPPREVSAGIGEIIKHGMLADGEYFDDIEKNIDQLLSLDPHTTADIVARSCRIKSGVVSRDTKEKGERAKLNLGHTFGHAIEKLSGYGTWLHGEAVGCGLVLAAEMSEKLGTLRSEDKERIVRLVEKAGLPVRIEGLSLEGSIAAMKGDKKSTAGTIHFVLLDGIGLSYVTEVPEQTLREVLVSGGYV